MKIVHTESSWGWGGQEIRILHESRALRERGHQVHVVADPRSHLFSMMTDGDGGLRAKLKRKRLEDLISLRSALVKLAPDIVVCHSSTDHWLTALARLSIKVRFPIVRMRHISAAIRPDFATRWLYGNGCEKIVTTGMSIRQHLIETNLAMPEKIISIPTGLDPEKYFIDQAIARESLGLKSGTFLIGIIATLRSWKGHDYLIRAMSMLRASNAQLIIVGDGPKRYELHQLVESLGLEDKVSFVGQQQNTPLWFSALDLFVMPSFANEGVPQSILQAMATGLPIVSCPVGGIPEATRGYGAVDLVPVKNESKLAESIQYMMDNKDVLPCRGSLRLVPFSTADMANYCEKAYKETINDYQR